jgi:hypothetical protein
MSKSSVVARVGNAKLFLLFIFAIFIFVDFLLRGLNSFYYSAVLERSMYVRSFGYIAYLFLLFSYIGLCYYTIVHFIYRKKLIRVQDGKLFYLWRNVCNLDEIDFSQIRYGTFPISILFSLKTGKVVRLKYGFSNESGERITSMLKEIALENG